MWPGTNKQKLLFLFKLTKLCYEFSRHQRGGGRQFQLSAFLMMFVSCIIFLSALEKKKHPHPMLAEFSRSKTSLLEKKWTTIQTRAALNV
jgi:hypothetical protein